MATSRTDPRVVAAVNKAMEVAYSYEGTVDPDGNFVWNEVYPAFRGQAWCGGFMVLIFRRVGIDLMKCAWWYYTPYIYNFAKNRGFLRDESGYGWEPLFDWGNGIAHVGAANPDNGSDLFRSIEGNTSSGSAGSQSNGGGVWERYRYWENIVAWVDMHAVLAWMIDTGLWKPGATLPNTSEHASSGSALLVPDGWWGPATTRALQRINGTPIDGIISSQDVTWRDQNPGLQAGFEWVSSANAKGSQLISKMQATFQNAGIYHGKIDGLIGPMFINALSAYYGLEGDNVLDGPSNTVMAMQRAINKQLGGK